MKLLLIGIGMLETILKIYQNVYLELYSAIMTLEQDISQTIASFFIQYSANAAFVKHITPCITGR